MQWLGTFSRYCIHKLWWLFVIGVVLLACVVSFLRLALPYATSYKTSIEQLINERTGANVHIGQLSAAWQSSGPTLLLQQVAVKANQQTAFLQVAEARVGINFWQSLRALTPVADHFELSGLQLELDSEQLLSQTAPTPVSDNQALTEAIENLLFRQLQQFTLVDSQLTVRSKYTPPIVFQIRQLSWLNEAERHQGRGDVAIAGVTGNTLSFLIDLQGPSLAKSRGQLYLSSQALNILPWFETLVPDSKKLASAEINFQAWGDIEQGALSQIQIALAENRLQWQQQGRSAFLSLGNGQLQWRPTEQGWQLLSSDLTLKTEQQSWHDFRVQLVREQGSHWASLQQLPISASRTLLELLAQDNPALEQLLKYQVQGQLTELGAKLDADHWFVRGDFIDLQNAPVADVPGMQGLSGSFSASPQFIRADIHGRDGALRWDGAFDQDTAYQHLDTRLQVLQTEQGWQLRVPQLSLRQPELALDAQLMLAFGEKPQLYLVGELRQVPVQQASWYFPRRHMPESVINYLKPALVSGHIPSARVLWHGAFADYPYAEAQGIFQALAMVDDTEFSFDPSWPSIQKMQAELLFENAQMVIQSQAGSLFGLELADGVTTRIPDLFHADNLLIDIQRQASAEQVTGLMLASPLSDSVGATLDYLGVQGPVQAAVQLEIGLKESHVTAKGDVEFQKNQLAIRAPAVAIDQLQGKLSFVNEQIRSDQLQMQWQGLPLQAELTGEQQAAHYQVQLHASGEQESQALLAVLAPAWQPLVTGVLNYDWQLAIQLPAEGFVFDTQARLDLTQNSLSLPAPFGKEPGDAASILLAGHGNQQGSEFNLQYGEQLNMRGHLDQASGRIDAARLNLGANNPQPLAPGFLIEASLAKAEFVDWVQLLQTQLASIDTETPTLFPALTTVRATVDELHLFDDAHLRQLQLQLTPAEQHWRLQVQGPQLQGEILLGQRLQEQGIQANLQRFQLIFDRAAEEKLEEEALKAQWATLTEAQKPDYAALEAAAFAELTPMTWLADLPPIQITCQQCTIGDYPLGQVSLVSHGDGERWTLESFIAERKQHRWQLQGEWQKDGSLGQTQLSGRLSTPALGQLLRDYDISQSMTGSRATVEFSDIQWLGAPFQFNRQTLSGELAWELGEGTLSEVSDGGARLFSLLSLDSLLRKLRLDFRDVFAKGFFYSQIKGSMTLTEGVSKTQDTLVDGAAGLIEIQGSANLKARKINYLMDFSPKVTSSLPVIVAWMVNPVTGVAAYALDEMFQSAEVISKIRFAVHGDLDAPTVEELKRDSKQIDIPGAKPSGKKAGQLGQPTTVTEPVAIPLRPPSEGVTPAQQQPEQLPEQRPMLEAAPVGGDEEPTGD